MSTLLPSEVVRAAAGGSALQGVSEEVVGTSSGAATGEAAP